MGSTKININFVMRSQGLHSQLQSIAGQLETAPSTRQVTKLTKELDKTSSALREMKNKAHSVFGQSQQDHFGGLEDEIVNMYGRLQAAMISGKVSQIQQEAHSLKESMAQGGQVDAKLIHTIKRHIFRLLKDYRPGVQERQVIADAKKTIKEAEQGKPSKEKVVSHFEWLSGQKNVRFVEEMESEPDQYEDLFDIAAMVYNGKSREAKARFNQLPEELKRSFQLHMRELTAVPFEDERETIQALLATANKLVGNGELYPTKSEIDEIFLGLKLETAGEEKGPALFELRSS